MRINGDESTNVHTSTAAATTKSPSQLDEASGDDSPNCKGIRLRTFSTPVQSSPKSKFSCDTDSRMNVNHKVLFRRNNSLIPDVVGDDFDNISIHSDEWLAQRQSFLRMLSQAKSRKLSQARDESSSSSSSASPPSAAAAAASSHSPPPPPLPPPQVVARDNGACEETTPSQVASDSSLSRSPHPPTHSTSSPPSPPVLQICPPCLKATAMTGGHHSSSSEDEEWHAHIQWLRQNEGMKNPENILHTHEVDENHELKSHFSSPAAASSRDPTHSQCVPATALPPLATVTQQKSALACYSADSGASTAELTSINTCSLKQITATPGNEQSHEKNEPPTPPAAASSHSIDTKHETSRNSCKKLSNKCPGCMLV